MDVTVIGTGYVGLVAGACFADSGHKVICVDSDPTKIAALKRGEIPIYEPGLDAIVARTSKDGRLRFTTDTAEGVQKSDVIFLAVGTPSLPNGSPNLSYLQAAAEAIGKSMNGPKIVVNKSTVPVGTHRLVAEWVSAHTSHSVEVASNPEFLKEGHAIEDFTRPDRVVLGTLRREVFEKLSELYAPFVRQGNPVLWMDPTTAETTKYACNAFLATKISFMNELSALCEAVGADIESLRSGMATDARIGRHFLYAGAGFGGSCFPKDIRALVSTAERHSVRLGIVSESLNANERQKRRVFEKILAHFDGDLKGRTIGVWGLAFKPNTDDVREAPALTIVRELLKAGATVKTFDPVATETFARELGLTSNGVVACATLEEAASGADGVVLLTEWNEFKNPNFSRILSLMKGNYLLDARNILIAEQATEAGFNFEGIGRPKAGSSDTRRGESQKRAQRDPESRV